MSALEVEETIRWANDVENLPLAVRVSGLELRESAEEVKRTRVNQIRHSGRFLVVYAHFAECGGRPNSLMRS